MGGSLSAETPEQQFTDLERNGHSIGPVMTRYGFGHAVERGNYSGADYIMHYTYPFDKYEALPIDSIVATRFIVMAVWFNRAGACIAKIAFGKNQTKNMGLSESFFDKKPFGEDGDTLRTIVTRAYETWKENPENAYEEFSEDSLDDGSSDAKFVYEYSYEES